MTGNRKARQLISILQGGHFAALEQPEALKSDLTKFVEQVWPGLS